MRHSLIFLPLTLSVKEHNSWSFSLDKSFKPSSSLFFFPAMYVLAWIPEFLQFLHT